MVTDVGAFQRAAAADGSRPPVAGGDITGLEPRRTPDAAAVRVVARVRVAVAVGLAAIGSFVPHLGRRPADLFVLLALLWVPWASAVLFAADRPGNRFAVLGGPIGDLVALFAVQALLPHSSEAVLLGDLVVVLFAAYTAGRSAATLMSVGAMALTIVGQAFVLPADRLSLSELVPFSAALVALVLLQERVVSLEVRATDRSRRLEGMSEAVLARVADGVLVTDPASRVLQCNPAAERIVGLDDSEIVAARAPTSSSCASGSAGSTARRVARCSMTAPVARARSARRCGASTGPGGASHCSPTRPVCTTATGGWSRSCTRSATSPRSSRPRRPRPCSSPPRRTS